MMTKDSNTGCMIIVTSLSFGNMMEVEQHEAEYHYEVKHHYFVLLRDEYEKKKSIS